MFTILKEKCMEINALRSWADKSISSYTISSMPAHPHCHHLKSGALVGQRLHLIAWKATPTRGVNHLSHPEPDTANPILGSPNQDGKGAEGKLSS